MNPLDPLVNALNGATVKQETAADFNLVLTRMQFEARMLKEHNGLELLQLLERAGPSLEQLQLLLPYKRSNQWFVDVPSWFKLVAYLNMLLSMGSLRADATIDLPWNVHQDRCREKTARGNVYLDKDIAATAARKMAIKKRAEIVAFKCKVCERYHIGRKRDERSK